MANRPRSVVGNDTFAGAAYRHFGDSLGGVAAECYKTGTRDLYAGFARMLSIG